MPKFTGHSFVDDDDLWRFVRIALSEATPCFKWYLQRVEVHGRHGKKIGIACGLRCRRIPFPQISTAEIEGISAKRQTQSCTSRCDSGQAADSFNKLPVDLRAWFSLLV